MCLKNYFKIDRYDLIDSTQKVIHKAGFSYIRSNEMFLKICFVTKLFGISL